MSSAVSVDERPAQCSSIVAIIGDAAFVLRDSIDDHFGDRDPYDTYDPPARN